MKNTFRIWRALSLYEYGWKREALYIMTEVIQEEVDGYVKETEKDEDDDAAYDFYG